MTRDILSDILKRWLGTPQAPAKVAALPAKHMLILRTHLTVRLNPLPCQHKFYCVGYNLTK